MSRKMIYLDDAIEAVSEACFELRGVFERCEDALKALPSASEPLTDKEQRIFLAAMGVEEKICKQVEEEYKDCRKSYEDSLIKICHEIKRKVKSALWTS